MAGNTLEMLAGRYDGLGEEYWNIGSALRILAQETRKLNSPEYFEQELLDMLGRQVLKLLWLGFNEELDQTAKEYIAGFNIPGSQIIQPEAYRRTFNTLLIVDPRIPLSRQHQRAGINEECDTSQIYNLIPVPDNPYIVWTYTDDRYQWHSVPLAEKTFSANEVGMPQVEVTALFLQFPDIFHGPARIAAGSRLGSETTELSAFASDPLVGTETLHPQFPGGFTTVMSRGREIILLGNR